MIPSSTSGRSTSCWALLKVNLVEEEDRPLAALLQVPSRFGEDLADFLRAGGDRVHRLEAALRVVGDDVGEGGLAGAGRAVEDERAEPVGDEHARRSFLAEDVLLADELVERPRPHAGRADGRIRDGRSGRVRTGP